MIALFGPLKNGFWGQKTEDLTPGVNRTQRNTPTTETRFWMHWATIHASQGKLWTHWRNQKIKIKKIKKAREGATSPICPTQPPFSTATIFCMCCRTVDIITHARFQVNRFRGFGAPGGRKWPSPIDLAHRPYDSVRTNVLHCEQCNFCRFRASAYTKVNRLCAVFLYNICCFMISLKPVRLLKDAG